LKRFTFLFSGGNYFIVKIWGEGSPAPLAATICCFIIGATVSPLIAIPFLSANVNASTNNSETSVVGTNDSDVTSIHWDFRRDVKIEALYFILMVIACVSGLGLASGSALIRRTGDTLTAKDTKQNKPEAIISQGFVQILVISLMFLFIMVIIGLELNFYGMVAPYIILDLHGTEQEGTLMVSYFWGIYSIFSILGIPTFYYFTPSTLLLVNLVFMTVANIVLVACDQTWKTLWIGTTLLSMAFGTTYSGVFNWGDFYLDLSHQVSAVLVAGGQLGSVVVPLVTGPSFAAEPFALMKITLICAVICDVLFVLIEVIAYPSIRIHRPTSLGLRKLRESGYRDMDKL
jgi:fucose permease